MFSLSPAESLRRRPQMRALILMIGVLSLANTLRTETIHTAVPTAVMSSSVMSPSAG